MELTGNSNAATATTFLRQLRARHIGPLTVIWENSTAHRGASPVVHADETGGWEDGHNGYVWTFSTPTERYFCVGAGARGRWMKPWAIPSPACWSAFLRRLPSLLRPQTTLLGPPAAGHPRPANLIPLQKWLTLVTKHRQSIPENTDHAAPPPQQFKTAPPRTLTQEHRTGSPLKPSRVSYHSRPPEPDWVGVSASPAGAALQAPVSVAPLSLPSTSTRASLASSRVR